MARVRRNPRLGLGATELGLGATELGLGATEEQTRLVRCEGKGGGGASFGVRVRGSARARG